MGIFLMDERDQQHQSPPLPTDRPGSLGGRDHLDGHESGEEGQGREPGQAVGDQTNQDINGQREDSEDTGQGLNSGHQEEEDKQEAVGGPEVDQSDRELDRRPGQDPESLSPDLGLGGDETARQNTPRPPLDGKNTGEIVQKGRETEDEKPKMDDILQVRFFYKQSNLF